MRVMLGLFVTTFAAVTSCKARGVTDEKLNSLEKSDRVGVSLDGGDGDARDADSSACVYVGFESAAGGATGGVHPGWSLENTTTFQCGDVLRMITCVGCGQQFVDGGYQYIEQYRCFCREPESESIDSPPPTSFLGGTCPTQESHFIMKPELYARCGLPVPPIFDGGASGE